VVGLRLEGILVTDYYYYHLQCTDQSYREDAAEHFIMLLKLYVMQPFVSTLRSIPLMVVQPGQPGSMYAWYK